MTKYEYKVIAAPRKAGKVKGLKRGEDRFAATLAEIMNRLGAEGWQYQRTDTLPVESRAGVIGHTTRFHNMLVFRRVINESAPLADVSPEAEAEGQAAKQSPAAMVHDSDAPPADPPVDAPVAPPVDAPVAPPVQQGATQPDISSAKA